MVLSNKSISLVVLAAGRQPLLFGVPSTRDDSGFLNAGTKLAIERIYSFYSDYRQLKTILVVADSTKKIYRLRPYTGIEIIGVGKTTNVIESLKIALDHVKTPWCLINPITAVPSSYLSSDGAAYFGLEKIPKENWSSLTLSSNDGPVFHPKEQTNSIGLFSHPFTGRIEAQTIHICQALEELKKDEHDDLIHLVTRLIYMRQVRIKYEKWIDAGHLATYAESKLYSISARHFNSLSYIQNTNTIVKRSSNAEKLQHEAEFIDQVPIHLRRFFPTVIRSTGSSQQWEVELEYVGYPSLSEIFLFGDFGPNTWKRIIDSLRQVYEAFYSSKAISTENANWLYSSKTESRQQEFEIIIDQSENHLIKFLYHNEYEVNGIKLPPLKTAFENIKRFCKQLEQSCHLHIGHGDMCFNNILIDPVYGTLKLIDPKAVIHPRTGQCGLMHGPYDLAKLNHSFAGLYDSIVNGLYDLTFDNQGNLQLHIYAPQNFLKVLQLFQDRLLQDLIDEISCTKATANLFLSMLPLHKEDIDRMIAFGIVGTMLAECGSIKSLMMPL